MNHRKELVKLLQANAYSRSLWDVWRDFVEMSALAIANAADRRGWDEREARYMEIVGQYDREGANRFAQALALLTECLNERAEDVLGSLFMELELGSKWGGQFFTPYELCLVMAKLTLDPIEAIREQIDQVGYVTACEPACGGGAMLIALAEAMRDVGINYQQQLHVTAVDVDVKAVHMTYVQLSLLGVPAVVVHGNALSLEEWSQWRTPMHTMGAWEWKLGRAGKGQETAVEARQPPTPKIEPGGQLLLALEGVL